MQPNYIQHIRTPEEVVYDHPEGHYIVLKHLEYIGGEWRTYVHTEVFYKAPSTLKHMIAHFDGIRAGLPPVIGAFNWQVGSLSEHFMTKFGFEKMADIEWDDGVTRPFWVHRRPK